MRNSQIRNIAIVAVFLFVLDSLLYRDPGVELSHGYEIAAIETSARRVDIFDWTPRYPVCVMFGHEVDGLTEPLREMADTHVRIPMLGTKHSLNVATAGGVVLYELLRKRRTLGSTP